MAIEVNFMYDGYRAPSVDSSGNITAATLRYRIWGTESMTAAIAALVAEMPATYEGCEQTNLRVDPDGTSCQNWIGTVSYENKLSGAGAGGDSLMATESWSAVESTAHITTALSDLASYKPSSVDTAPDPKRLINVEKNGKYLEVKGIDVVVPRFNFKFWTIWDTYGDSTGASGGGYNWLSDEARIFLGSKIGKVNDATFRGWEAGEIMLKGVDPEYYSDTQTKVVYSCEISLGAKNTALRPAISIRLGDDASDQLIQKEGWDLFTVRCIEQRDAASSSIIQVPMFAFTQRIKERIDFGVF